MHYIVTKEAIDAMMKAPGEVRGAVFKTDESFVLEKGGKKKIKEVERELEEMGHPFLYKNVDNMKFYPWGMRVLSLLAISMVFNMDKKAIEEMGRVAPKKSFIVKFFMRHFFTIESTFKKASEMWRDHHTIGRLEVVELNSEEKKATVRLYNLNFHPIFCDYLCGYFAAIAKIVEGKEVNCKEVKCFFKGESFFHEFLLTW
jgi:hypothetical protein